MNSKTDPPSNVERLLMALLQPMIKTMRDAGIARMNFERDGSVLLQMQNGEVIGPLPRTVHMTLKEFHNLSESIL